MLLGNETITIYNKHANGYKRTVLRGVSWYSKQAVSVTKEGLFSADTVIIRIPASIEGYVQPKAWAQSQIGWPVQHWTLQNGDRIVKGDVPLEITDGKISALEKNYDNVITVMSIGDNRRGKLPHFRVGGK